jgi:hypothetical protein
MSSNKVFKAAKELPEQSVDYYDVSGLPDPIALGDHLHNAICEYRKSLPDKHLPPGEAELMRRLLDGSRAKGINQQCGSQSAARSGRKCC